MPGRTDNEIKNYWNTTLVKKLQGKSSQFEKSYPTVSTQTKSNSSCAVTELLSTETTIVTLTLPANTQSNMTMTTCDQDAPLMLPLLAPEEYSRSAMDMVAETWPSDLGAWEETNLDGIPIAKFRFESKGGDGIRNYQDLNDLMVSDGAMIGNWVEDDGLQPSNTLTPSF